MNVGITLITLSIIIAIAGCSSTPRIMYKHPDDNNVATVEFTASTSTTFSLCYNKQWENISDHSVDTNALFDFGIPGFASETVKSVTIDIHASQPVIIGGGMSTSRLRCSISKIAVLDRGKKYKYIATLSGKMKKCSTDLIEINDSGEEKKITKKLARNYTPCDKFIPDDDAFVRNREYQSEAKNK